MSGSIIVLLSSICRRNSWLPLQFCYLLKHWEETLLVFNVDHFLFIFVRFVTGVINNMVRII